MRKLLSDHPHHGAVVSQQYYVETNAELSFYWFANYRWILAIVLTIVVAFAVAIIVFWMSALRRRRQQPIATQKIPPTSNSNPSAPERPPGPLPPAVMIAATPLDEKPKIENNSDLTPTAPPPPPGFPPVGTAWYPMPMVATQSPVEASSPPPPYPGPSDTISRPPDEQTPYSTQNLPGYQY